MIFDLRVSRVVLKVFKYKGVYAFIFLIVKNIYRL
jgi:hypothetical protein